MDRPTTIEVTRLWKQLSGMSRLSLLGIVACFVVRRVVWMFTTPISRADAPRALLMVNFYLVLCYVELACIALCLLAIWFDVCRLVRSSKQRDTDQNADNNEAQNAEDGQTLPEGSIWPPPPNINP